MTPESNPSTPAGEPVTEPDGSVFVRRPVAEVAPEVMAKMPFGQANLVTISTRLQAYTDWIMWQHAESALVGDPPSRVLSVAIAAALRPARRSARPSWALHGAPSQA